METDNKIKDIRAGAVSAQKDKLLALYPKALLYCTLMMLPTLLLFLFASSKMSSNATAGKTIEFLSVIVPLVFGGPLSMGFLSVIMNITKDNGKTTLKQQFFAFSDKFFFKSIGTFIVFVVICGITGFILHIPSFLGQILQTAFEDALPYVLSETLIILLTIAGIILAVIIVLRFILAFPLIIENEDLKIKDAFTLSFKIMKKKQLQLFLLMLSYIGWFLLSLAIAYAILAIVSYVVYQHILSIQESDFMSAYTMLLIGLIIFYISFYILTMIAVSTVIARPTFAFAVFYEKLAENTEIKQAVPDMSGKNTANKIDTILNEETVDVGDDSNLASSDETAGDSSDSNLASGDETADDDDDDANSELPDSTDDSDDTDSDTDKK